MRTQIDQCHLKIIESNIKGNKYFLLWTCPEFSIEHFKFWGSNDSFILVRNTLLYPYTLNTTIDFVDDEHASMCVKVLVIKKFS